MCERTDPEIMLPVRLVAVEVARRQLVSTPCQNVGCRKVKEKAAIPQTRFLLIWLRQSLLYATPEVPLARQPHGGDRHGRRASRSAHAGGEGPFSRHFTAGEEREM